MANADVFRKLMDAFNRHDAEAAALFYVEDAVAYDPAYPEPLKGREAIRADLQTFFTSFPDAQAAIKETTEEGNVVATQMMVTGVQDGPLPTPAGEIPATGKTVTLEGGFFSRFNSQGLIVEEHRYYDVLGQMSQLGLMPEGQAVS